MDKKYNDIDLDEIKNWQSFQDLIKEYFEQVKNENEFNVENVEVQRTGDGSDGGKDILVKMKVSDSISQFNRIWVVQCKFVNNNIGKSQIADVNIPSIIHEYGANGYLLVCKKGVSSRLSDSFDHLNKNCKFGYRYEFWTGNEIIRRVRIKDNLLKMFFPKYYKFMQKQEKEIGDIS